MKWPRRLSLAPDGSVLESVLAGNEAENPVDAALPRAVAQLERIVTISTGRSSAWELHQRLRPVLRDIARHRVRVRHGLDLDADRDIDAVRDRLGEDLYDLVRPGRPEPSDRRGPGITLMELDEYVARLEAL